METSYETADALRNPLSDRAQESLPRRRKWAVARQRTEDADKLPPPFKAALRRLLGATDQFRLADGRYTKSATQRGVTIRTARQMYGAGLLTFIVDNGCSRIELTARGRVLAEALGGRKHD